VERLKNFPGLVSRQGTYYVRVKVPRELLAALKRRELKRSLETKDLAEAKRRYRRIYADLMRALTEAQDRLAVRPTTNRVAREDLEAAVLEWFEPAWQRCLDGLRNPPVAGGPDVEEMIGDAERTLDIVSQPNDESAGHQRDMARRLLQGRDIRSPDEQSITILAGYLDRGMRLLSKAVLDQYRGKQLHHEIDDPLFRAAAASVGRVQGLTVGEAIDRFQADPQRKKLAPKNALGYRMAFRLLAEVAGADAPLHTVGRAHARAAQELLSKLPPNATKRFPKLTLRQVAQQAEAQRLKPLQHGTAENLLSNLSAFFSWCMREEHAVKNPFEGLRPLQDEKAEEESRQPYDDASLQRIFSSALFSEKEERERFPGRYWVPLLALYHGARSNEACQIEVGDVAMEDGIAVLRLREEGEDEHKRLKNPHSKRTVPVHPRILVLGFMEHVSQQRERGEKMLFPDLRVAATGYRSDNFSKWFRRFQKGIGQTDPRMSFHSFRHNFRDAARAARIPAEIVSELGGWSKAATERDAYGKGHPLARRLEELSKITYPAVERILFHQAAPACSSA
jgi:integrase